MGHISHFGIFALQTKAPNSIIASTKSEFLLVLNKFFLLIFLKYLKSILLTSLFNILEITLFTFPSNANVGVL